MPIGSKHCETDGGYYPDAQFKVVSGVLYHWQDAPDSGGWPDPLPPAAHPALPGWGTASVPPPPAPAMPQAAYEVEAPDAAEIEAMEEE